MSTADGRISTNEELQMDDRIESRNTGIKEETVDILNATFPLKGTITLPNAKYPRPAVLIIPGTGTSDRDGKNKKFDLKLYKEIAHIIGSLGFVALRYDKRGLHESRGDFYEAGLWDFVDDAVACIEFLKSRREVDSNRIIILGHSEGSIIAPAVNRKIPVQGLVLLAGVCESLREAGERQNQLAFREMEQMSGLKGVLIRKLNVVKKQQRKAEKFTCKILNSTKPWLRILWVKIPAKWMREHYSYNVADDLRAVTCPTLAITGSKDVQVDPSHAQAIAETVRGESEWHVIPNMTHILRKADGEVRIMNVIKTYKSILTMPFDPDLKNLLTTWLVRHFS